VVAFYNEADEKGLGKKTGVTRQSFRRNGHPYGSRFDEPALANNPGSYTRSRFRLSISKTSGTQWRLFRCR
jgi:hypothetical protein